MLKFIKHHMSTIEGIDIYPIISLTVFVLFFAGLLIWVFRADKQSMDTVRRYPLNEDTEPTPTPQP